MDEKGWGRLVDAGRETLIHVRKLVAVGPKRCFCIGTSFKFQGYILYGYLLNILIICYLATSSLRSIVVDNNKIYALRVL